MRWISGSVAAMRSQARQRSRSAVQASGAASENALQPLVHFLVEFGGHRSQQSLLVAEVMVSAPRVRPAAVSSSMDAAA